MLNTKAGTCGYTEIQCIWSKSGYNEIQSFLKSMNLALDTIRYNVSGPSLDTMDTIWGHLLTRGVATQRDFTRQLMNVSVPRPGLGYWRRRESKKQVGAR